jgi:glycosyltransferase involved in cell wall biosynthesis
MSAEDTPLAANPPVLGFVLFGGSLSGALVRDVRLANECAARGYPVHVWWAMDWQHNAGLRPEIHQHWLFNGLRYWTRMPAFRGALDGLGRRLNRFFGDKARAHGLQKRPRITTRLMNNLTRDICDGVDRDAAMITRFARDLKRHRVTHVLPMLEMLCLWVDAARGQLPRDSLKYLVTFQGYELYSTYARALGEGLEQQLYRRLKETVAHSDFPAIAVSEDYRHRVHEEIHVPLENMVAIPPGVPDAARMAAHKAQKLVKSRFYEYVPDVPLIVYPGRRDTEKGIDLLLYAAKILVQHGLKFQLAICGPTLWGDHYGSVCQKIAEELRINVLWRRFVQNDVRSALFSIAHCVVYPSIHREPFGMVAAEAAAHGAPAIVPDYGGVASAIEAHGECAGLRFKAWDSGDLADQIARLLNDRVLHAEMVEAGPRVAEYYSIANLADRVLTHIDLPIHRDVLHRAYLREP